MQTGMTSGTLAMAGRSTAVRNMSTSPTIKSVIRNGKEMVSLRSEPGQPAHV